MNKLVIVGNGFDLAHGLPTSYKHFIDDFWGNLFQNYKKDEIKELVFLDDGFETFHIESELKNFTDFANHGTRYIQWFKDNYEKNRFFNSKNHEGKNDVFYFKNDFFELINSKNSIENWVDIENEYYQGLKEISKQKPLKSSNRITATRKQQEGINKKNAKRLNLEFEQVKLLFEKYLSKTLNQKFYFKYQPTNISHLLEHFEINHRGLQKKHNLDYLLEFPLEDHKDLIEFDNKIEKVEKEITFSGMINTLMINEQSLFLNFNYTDSIDIYIYHL